MQLRHLAALGVLLAATSASASPSPGDLRIAVSQDSKWGFIDGTGKLVIPFWFTSVGEFHNGIGCGDGHYIDAAGRRLVEQEVGDCPTTGDLVPTASGDLAEPAAFMDRTGKLTPVSLDAENLGGLHDGRARAFSHSSGLWGYLDAHGAWAIKPQYGSARTPDERTQVAHCDEVAKTKVRDPDVVKACVTVLNGLTSERLAAQEFSEGRAAVRIGDRWGFISTDGKQVLAPKWRSYAFFLNGLALVTLDDNTQQFIDNAGKVVAGPFAAATAFAEGFAIVRDASGQHFIDAAGKTPFALPADTANEHVFSGGLALVERTNRSIGYIDKTGAWVIQPRFWTGGQFVDGYARVEFADGPDHKYSAIIDTTGKALWVSAGGKPTFDRWASWKIGDPAPKPVAAAPATPAPHAGAKAAAGRFVVDPTDKDAVLDTQTGLEWAAHDNGADVSLDGAWAYATAYRGGGHSDWRLPTDYELADLAAADLAHKEPGDCTGGKSYYVLTPLIHITCGLMWSSTSSDIGGTGFGFISGKPRSSSRNETTNYRALVVRHG